MQYRDRMQNQSPFSVLFAYVAPVAIVVGWLLVRQALPGVTGSVWDVTPVWVSLVVGLVLMVHGVRFRGV